MASMGGIYGVVIYLINGQHGIGHSKCTSDKKHGYVNTPLP